MAKKKEKNVDVLRNAFENEESPRAELARRLLNEADFLQNTMNDLKKQVADEGVLVQMQQGDYFITKANPAIASYNTCIKNFNTIVKQLNELLPREDSVTKSDLFDQMYDKY